MCKKIVTLETFSLIFSSETHFLQLHPRFHLFLLFNHDFYVVTKSFFFIHPTSFLYNILFLSIPSASTKFAANSLRLVHTASFFLLHPTSTSKILLRRIFLQIRQTGEALPLPHKNSLFYPLFARKAQAKLKCSHFNLALPANVKNLFLIIRDYVIIHELCP